MVRLGKEWKKNVPFFYKGRKRTERTERSLKRTDAQPWFRGKVLAVLGLVMNIVICELQPWSKLSVVSGLWG